MNMTHPMDYRAKICTHYVCTLTDKEVPLFPVLHEQRLALATAQLTGEPGSRTTFTAQASAVTALHKIRQQFMKRKLNMDSN